MSEQRGATRDVVYAPRGFKVKLATAGLIIAVSCAAAAIFSGIGYRLSGTERAPAEDARAPSSH